VRTLITGGAGFIGSHLADFLVTQGHHVLVVDNLSTGRMANVEHLLAEDRFRFFDDTILNESLTDDLVAGVDQVYHLAASVGVKHIIDEPVGCIHTHINGTSMVLEKAAAHGKRIVIASSSEVHGKSTEVPLAEDGDCLLGPPTVRRWSYALSKAIDENWPLPTREATSRSPSYASSTPTTHAWMLGAMGEPLLASLSRRSSDDPSRGTTMASRPAASPTSTTPHMAPSRGQ
jgi:nucleoside-diphosphate-sugar epimerase